MCSPAPLWALSRAGLWSAEKGTAARMVPWAARRSNNNNKYKYFFFLLDSIRFQIEKIQRKLTELEISWNFLSALGSTRIMAVIYPVVM